MASYSSPLEFEIQKAISIIENRQKNSNVFH